MESACQVKGCKSNKKASKHEARILKENNNINYSDEEYIDETSKPQQQSTKKNNLKTGSTTVSSNKSNNNTTSHNKNSSSSHVSNKVSSNNRASTNDMCRVVKTTTPELTYNKVVSSNKAPTIATADLAYNKVVSNGKHAAPTTTTTTDLANNKVLSSYKTTTNDISYSKVVSNNFDSLTTKVASLNLLNDKISSGNVEVDGPTTTTTTATTINEESNTVAVDKPKPKTEGGDADAQQRRAVLSYEQVSRLNDVMNEVVSIHGRGNFPTLEVKLRDLVTVVRGKLEADQSLGGAGMKVRDIRLNGGAASHVLATESQPYNDLDLIFAVELSSGRNYDKVKAAVLSSLFDLLPEGVSRKRITTCSLKEAYVSKMVKVSNDGDRWSLISLGNSRGHRNVELKFVDSMRRQFEFSVDSFQIVLDSLLQFHTAAAAAAEDEQQQQPEKEISESLHPQVVGESVYGDFHEALYHLQKKLISTRHPEEIRGGGLLKYCNLLVKMYKPAKPDYIKTLERYMCSRFFIDFPDIAQQRAKLENYLWNHFVGPEEEALKYQYLTLLHSVVEESTVCLMGHERRQTLALIEALAYQVLCQEQQQRLTNHQAQAPAAYVYANGYYYAPVIPTACYTCTCNSWMACSS